MTQENIYIGFDRDGTLEMPGYPIPEKLIKQFQLLKERGIYLFLASGKSHSLLSNITAKISLDPWMICAEAGGHIVIPSKNIDTITGKNTDLFSFKKNIGSIKLPPHKEEEKVSLWSKKFGGKVLEAEIIIKKFIADNNWNLNVYSYPDGDGGLDVVPPGIDKVNLLKYLPSQATIYYMGDDFNDWNLLAHERVIPCTISNAKKEIKELVSKREGFVSSHPAGEGVSSIISTIFSL